MTPLKDILKKLLKEGRKRERKVRSLERETYNLEDLTRIYGGIKKRIKVKIEKTK